MSCITIIYPVVGTWFISVTK